jgi:hypothetical protein
MRKSPINMYKIPIEKICKVKSYWNNWLKYKQPIPNNITPHLINNLLGGYNATFYKRNKK